MTHSALQTLTLALSDPRSHQALRTGWLPHLGPSPVAKSRAVARKLISSGESDPEPSVLFELLEPATARPTGLGPWMQSIRAFSLTATGTPCLAIAMALLYQHQPLDALLGITALLGVLGLQIAINVFNDVEDYRRLIDLPGTLGGSGVIQNGWWTPQEQQRLAWCALIAGALLGLPAVLSEPQFLVPIAALGTLGVLLYSAKRLGLKYVALGDLAVFFLCGPALTGGFALAVSHHWNAGSLWLGVFFGLLAAAILHVNNLQDLLLDRDRGVKTFAIWLGFRGSLRFLSFLYLLAGASLVAGTASGALPFWSLAGLAPLGVVALPWVRSISGALGPESALLSNCRVKAAQIHLMSGVFLIFSLALGAVLANFNL